MKSRWVGGIALVLILGSTLVEPVRAYEADPSVGKTTVRGRITLRGQAPPAERDLVSTQDLAAELAPRIVVDDPSAVEDWQLVVSCEAFEEPEQPRVVLALQIVGREDARHDALHGPGVDVLVRDER